MNLSTKLILTVLIIISACSVSNSERINKTPAFPGAEGAGKYTTGGRGGMVYVVTNLEDDGPGSFRYGVNLQEPRIIVFAVSGNIHLKSPLNINHGNLTIAGQSAPGEGICIKGHGLRINADNVIFRYLRMRPGDIYPIEQDALTTMRHKNIIIDHCSMSWGTDEVFSPYNIENLTVQWCIISESLNDSHHSKGEHGYGGIWGGNRATFHHNLLAHHSSRNPRFQGARSLEKGQQELVEFVNNVVYNWGNKAAYGGEEGHYNIINNYFKPGPATNRSELSIILEPYTPIGKFYLSGNIVYGNEEASEDNTLAVSTQRGGPLDELIVYESFSVSDYQIRDTETAFKAVLKYAGVSNVRDTVDSRIIKEVKYGMATFGEGGIINSQNEVGGWPEFQYSEPLLDSDGDGMPDAWEIANGLDPNNPNDHNQYDLCSKYTNIEVYLNQLVEKK
ncbi:pectate lyase [Alkalitalea saponilacus]|uniref:Pectate lyase n=1 Tax=Alkalitalea saponilacus TaxID=889453 RepID=A0A1T5HSL5_9BACT|nr:pectate lyase [Alkalitalea saponilacus]ASB47755.1 pectate lyase [Alkalitalea saponilacus]SKC23686.1 Pectate lyase [Alkalitalea saponilacus]